MRRFYKTAVAAADNTILLDGRPVRTPRKAVLRLPTPGLATAVAAEWQAQPATIDPFAMPLTRLANTAIDRIGPERGKILEELLAFAGSDLVCYRAESPPGLEMRQAASWDPVVDWAVRQLDAPFVITAGVMHVEQPAAARAAYAAHLAGKSDFEIAALHNLTTLTGSALMAAMLAAGDLGAEAAWQAAHVDEDWQIEHWGQDSEAAERRAHRRAEFDACCRFLALLEERPVKS
jgi:chaperone required for assembly of F1-ATPase